MSDADIAIVGVAGCFPGAPSLEQFWHNLARGVESVGFHSPTAGGVPPQWADNDDYVPARATLDGIDRFDAAFFDYSPAEAALIDPQQRLFLEKAWEAFENAGYDPAVYRGSIGVYAGASTNSYLVSQFSPQELPAVLADLQTIIANDKDFLATRVSYKLNLRGPSINVHTACSTSLVAVHLACQALLLGECDMALAGGVSIRTPQRVGYLYQQGSIYSRDGHCRPFDSGPHGTTPGNGLGMVVLKRRAEAERDGDFVHALIKGSAVNNDGAGKVGFTAPSFDGQVAAVTEALAIADIAPQDVGYVETHGTGTELGDPIEAAALAEAFGTASTSERCPIGSVKSNIGHLDAAAGIAGLLKVVLSLQHERIPPTLHFRRANPQIRFEDTPFFVNDAALDWPRAEAPRHAGVSSFGIGGTNAHAVLEEAPPRVTRAPSGERQLIPVSAQSAQQLEQALTTLRAHLKAHPELRLDDVSYTLQVGRRAFSHRSIVSARTVEELIAALDERIAAGFEGADCEGRRTDIAFTFADPLPARGDTGFDAALGAAAGWTAIGVAPAFLVAPAAELDLVAEVQALLPQPRPVVPAVGEAIGVALTAMQDTERQDLIARLWLAGTAIDWRECSAPGRRVPLPTYPFDRKPCWVGPPEDTDRPAAAAGARPKAAAGDRAAAGPAEEGLVEIFENTLGLSGSVGVHDNFFDLGGHSLIVLQVLREIQERFGVELEPEDVFEATDIAELAVNVEQAMIADIAAMSEDEALALLKQQDE